VLARFPAETTVACYAHTPYMSVPDVQTFLQFHLMIYVAAGDLIYDFNK